ncbi:ras-related protein Rab-8B-like [Styela clava]
MEESEFNNPNPLTKWICKLAIIGDSGTGKTSIIQRYVQNTFSPSHIATIGVDFQEKKVRIANRVIKVKIWDTAGQERFRSLTKGYYRGAKGILIVYDITVRKSFDRLEMWVRNVKKWADENTICIILGNKCDREDFREVSKEHGENIAKQYDMETSAKDAININGAFQCLIENVIEENKDKIAEYNEKNDNGVYENIELRDTTTPSPIPANRKKCCG